MIKNALELFSGTQSFGKVLKKKNYNVVSVDITDYKGKHIPTHKCDILEFDYKQYPKDHFDIIHASPPCIYYSNLQNCWLGRAKKNGEILTKELLEEKRKTMDKLVEKSLEIINYFNPRLWFMENPATGNLKKRDVVKDIPFYDVDYCMYSDWGYKKRTRFWTNKKDFDAKLCNKKCGNIIIINKSCIHKNNCGNTGQNKRVIEYHKTTFSPSKKYNQKVVGGGTNRLERYRIPPQLIEELIA